MSGLFGASHQGSSSRPNANTSPLIASYRVQTAVAGLVRPLLYGVSRVPGNIFFVWGFAATPVTTTTSDGGGATPGGKGGSPPGGENSSSTTTTYYYSMGVVWGLTEGAITKVGRCWIDKSLYYLSQISCRMVKGDRPQAPPPLLPAPNALGYPGLAFVINPSTSMGDQAILPNWSFEVFGLLPHNNPSTVTAEVHEALKDSTGLGAASGWGFSDVTIPLTLTAPGAPGTPETATFTLAASGFMMPITYALPNVNNITRVTLNGADLPFQGATGAPAPGAYGYDGTLFYFNSTDVGGTVIIYYQGAPEGASPVSFALPIKSTDFITAVTLDGVPLTFEAETQLPSPGSYSFSGAVIYFNPTDAGAALVTLQIMGLVEILVPCNFWADWTADLGVAWQGGGAPTFSNASPQPPGTYSVNNGYYRFSALDQGQVPLISYQYNPIPGSNAAEFLPDFLENPHYGVPGWPTGKIGDLTQFSNYIVANGFFLSPLLSEQQEARQIITDNILKLLNSQAVWCDDQLTFVPLGDEEVTGFGVTYTPNTTPALDLTEDDFLFKSGEDPVKTTRPSPANVQNQVTLEYLDRGAWNAAAVDPITGATGSGEFNTAVAQADDLNSIRQYGLNPLDTIQAHAITDTGVATQIARNILHYCLFAQQTYEFRLGIIGDVLRLMDLVTLTLPRLGLDRLPVYITDMQQDNNLEWTITATYWPIGAAQGALYPAQQPNGYSHDFNKGPGSINPPVIFEAPLGLAAGLEVWIAGCGGPDWGGAEVWLALDQSNYKKMGELRNPARLGRLLFPLLTGSDPDTVNHLRVDLTESRAILLSASQAEADALATPCYLDGEIICYQAADLTDTHKYDLSYLRRGCYQTAIADHPVGARFMRLDGAVGRFPYLPEWVGTKIYLKFLSYNTTRGGLQALEDVDPYEFTVTGAALKVPPPDVGGVVEVFDGQLLRLKWPAVIDPLAHYRSLDYEVRRGDAWTGAQFLAIVQDPEFVTRGDGTYWLAARTPLAYSAHPVSVTISGSVLTGNILVTEDEAALGWPGLGGRALSLDGSHHASVADHADLNVGTGDFTWEFLLKRTRNATEERLVNKLAVTVSPGYEVGLGADNLPYLRLEDGTGVSLLQPAAGGALADTGWHYLAISVDRDGNVIFCRDGNNYSTAAARPGSLDNSDPLLLGVYWDDAATPLIGAFGLARLTKRAKTADEMLLESAYLLAGHPPELLDAKVLWPFRGNLNDDSAGAHTLTWQGGGAAAYVAGLNPNLAVAGGALGLDTANAKALGYYLISGAHLLDQGACKPCFLSANLAVTISGAADFDGVVDVDSLPYWDQSGAGSATCKVQVALSSDGAAWGTYFDFLPGTYNFWMCKFRLIFSTGNTSLTPSVPVFNWLAQTPLGFTP